MNDDQSKASAGLPHRRRWFRYSLRTLFLATAVVALSLGWLRWQESKVRERQINRKYLEEAGAQFWENGNVQGSVSVVRLSNESLNPSWIRQWLGDQTVGLIFFDRKATPIELLLTACFPESCVIVPSGPMSLNESLEPLSDPQLAQPDERLIGTWRSREDETGWVSFMHIAHLNGGSPPGILQIAQVYYADTWMESRTSLAFSTTLADSTYLNTTDGEEDRMSLLFRSQKLEINAGYSIAKYRIEADRLYFRSMDHAARTRAISERRLKGQSSRLSDSTDKLARFVTEAGDSLFSKEERVYDRIK